jgi:endonuclease YncB( thermonuclease family)
MATLKKTVKPRYTLIKGKYWIHNPAKPRQGPQPDGDTVRFEPDALDLVRSLPRISGRPPNITSGGQINVRYEGIDTLETHFSNTHQNLSFANAAREYNLAQLGFSNVQFFADLPNVVQSVDKNPLPGYVLANGIEANGRMLGLVFSGASTRRDGEKVLVTNAILDQSVNAKLVVAGLAYVEPYDTMPMSLVRHLRTRIHAARNANKGLWPSESVSTGSAALIQSLADVQALIMWPKLFRRLATYFAEGHTGLGQFDAWIRDDLVGRDDTLRLPDGEKGNMHDTYLIDNDTLQLQFRPEDLLILPDPKP